MAANSAHWDDRFSVLMKDPTRVTIGCVDNFTSFERTSGGLDGPQPLAILTG